VYHGKTSKKNINKEKQIYPLDEVELMSEDEVKKLFDNAPEGSNLAILKECIEEAAKDTFNETIIGLMRDYGLTYGEAMIVFEQEFNKWCSGGNNE
jgi:hypothetical protein